MRELLEEARDRLLQNTPHRPGTCVECDNNRSTIAKITAALAEPEPDAMEVLQKVREEGQFNDGTGKKKPSNSFALPDSEAVALIEDYGRRVPRAMLDKYAELYFQSYDLRIDKDGLQKRTMDALAAKYGVKVEPPVGKEGE